MFGAGVVMFLLGGAMAFFFGHATGFGAVLARAVPGVMASCQAFVVRVGGADLWYNVVNPMMEAPCWAPFAALGAIFVLIGVLRRL